MQDDKTGGVPIRTVKSFLSKIPSVVTGNTLLQGVGNNQNYQRVISLDGSLRGVWKSVNSKDETFSVFLDSGPILVLVSRKKLLVAYH